MWRIKWSCFWIFMLICSFEWLLAILRSGTKSKSSWYVSCVMEMQTTYTHKFRCVYTPVHTRTFIFLNAISYRCLPDGYCNISKTCIFSLILTMTETRVINYGLRFQFNLSTLSVWIFCCILHLCSVCRFSSHCTILNRCVLYFIICVSRIKCIYIVFCSCVSVLLWYFPNLTSTVR